MTQGLRSDWKAVTRLRMFMAPPISSAWSVVNLYYLLCLSYWSLKLLVWCHTLRRHVADFVSNVNLLRHCTFSRFNILLIVDHLVKLKLKCMFVVLFTHLLKIAISAALPLPVLSVGMCFYFFFFFFSFFCTDWLWWFWCFQRVTEWNELFWVSPGSGSKSPIYFSHRKC